ncbi:hypothetical protein V8F33_005599 [Rhypophila sp. PSN 637]
MRSYVVKMRNREYQFPLVGCNTCFRGRRRLAHRQAVYEWVAFVVISYLCVCGLSTLSSSSPIRFYLYLSIYFGFFGLDIKKENKARIRGLSLYLFAVVKLVVCRLVSVWIVAILLYFRVLWLICFVWCVSFFFPC